MLKITKKTEYALIAISHIQSNGILVSSKDIAEKYSIPKELMAKVLQLIAKAGYIKAIKGPNGGYRSDVKLDDISLKEFIESIEGPLGLIDCQITEECTQINFCRPYMWRK